MLLVEVMPISLDIYYRNSDKLLQSNLLNFLESLYNYYRTPYHIQ